MKEYILVVKIATKLPMQEGQVVSLEEKVIPIRRILDISEVPQGQCWINQDVLDERIKNIIWRLDISQFSYISLTNDERIPVVGSPSDILEEINS